MIKKLDQASIKSDQDEVTQRLIAKACTDVEFRAALIKDPRRAISRELQVNFPENITIHLHQESPTDLHWVLPSILTPGELSNADLVTVVGAGQSPLACYEPPAACFSPSTSSGGGTGGGAGGGSGSTGGGCGGFCVETERAVGGVRG